MYRRHKERRRYSRRGQDRSRGSIFTSAFRTPGTPILVLLIVALVVYLSLQFGGGNSNLPGTIGASEAYNLYQSGAFVLGVRTVQEWNEYHVPNTTLIPLDELASRLDELPRDRQIVVVCRSGNRSQEGRDILLRAGFAYLRWV